MILIAKVCQGMCLQRHKQHQEDSSTFFALHCFLCLIWSQGTLLGRFGTHAVSERDVRLKSGMLGLKSSALYVLIVVTCRLLSKIWFFVLYLDACGLAMTLVQDLKQQQKGVDKMTRQNLLQANQFKRETQTRERLHWHLCLAFSKGKLYLKDQANTAFPLYIL